MSITYKYEIISVDEQARCMEIVYTADGHQTIYMGARLPYEGESIEAIVAMYAPLAYWHEQELKVILPTVGLTGTVVPEPLPTATGIVDQPSVLGAQTL